MPHLTLEYTANAVGPADPTSVLQELNQAIAKTTGIGIEKFKSRAMKRESYVVGAGDSDEGFVHLEVAIFGGRSQVIRDEIGRRSVAILKKHYGQSMGAGIQFTAEIRDVDRRAYFKRCV